MAKTRDVLSAAAVLDWLATEFFIYPELGSLVWKNGPKNHPRLAGQEAGSARRSRKKVYIHVKNNRRSLKRGWLIFLWVNKRWPTECLDHIDGDSENDSIRNLREATVTQNAWNHKRRAKKSALPMGVRQCGDRFQARIAVNKTMKHLGCYSTPNAAETAYLKARKEYFGDYA